MTLTEKMAAYALSFNTGSITPEIEAAAKVFFKDGVACIITGAVEPPVKAVESMLAELAGPPEVDMPLAEGLRLDRVSAATLLGMAMHIWDFDDMNPNMGGHSSTVVIPAVLALGQALGCGGRELLHAFIAGTETASILGRCLNLGNYNNGWNRTCAVSIFGAAAAAGWLLKLTAPQMAHALGIAANESGGLKANFGYGTKDLSVGMAAGKAIVCAMAAKAGITANPQALEGHYGLLETAAHHVDASPLDAAIAARQSDFLYPGLIMKPFPSCRATHNGVDGAFLLKRQHNINPEDIDTVHCAMQITAHNADLFPMPKDPTEGKFSMRYNLALALLQSSITIDDFRGSAFRDHRVVPLMQRMTLSVDDSFVNARFGAELTIHMKNGQQYHYRGEFAKGDPQNPMTPAETEAKFLACLAPLGIEAASKISAALDAMEQLQNMNDIMLRLATRKSI